MHFETILTERLILRKITPEAYHYVFTHYSDAELMAFFSYPSEAALEREKKRFANGITMFSKTFLWFHILDKETEKNIGWCGYHTWYSDHFRAEIGYGLHSDEYKQKGLMNEALKAVLDYGFEVMQLHRVEAMIAEWNVPSLKLAANFGFVREGLLREHYFVDGVAQDSVVFSLLKNEYQK